MSITYSVANYDSTVDNTVEVTYTDSETGFEHKRQINIPRDGSGEMDTEYFAEILEGQLRGVENKVRVGAVTFTDPNAVVEEPKTDPADPAV